VERSLPHQWSFREDTVLALAHFEKQHSGSQRGRNARRGACRQVTAAGAGKERRKVVEKHRHHAAHHVKSEHLPFLARAAHAHAHAAAG
jgi:hypothetical protein